ncbi:conserved Plasmodium protein, unknown function, partial [Plasmodium malariae]
EEIEQLGICQNLLFELEDCRNELYKHIKEDTPAMKNIPYIINKPSWLRDPRWFQNLQNQKNE